jgi:hypothetical protein
MGNGYTRNDTANNIADGNVINASDLDGEFDALQSAFNGTTGHSHDGTSGEGPQIAAGGIASNAVTTAKILDANITTAKIADANVTTDKIANDAVTLGTKTSGNYVAAGATSGTGISGSVSSEGGTFTVTSNATNANTASTIVARDGSGNFSAGTITATLTGNVTGNVTGDVTGNADTATTLETARTIAGQSFDGSANITIASTDLSDSGSINATTLDSLDSTQFLRSDAADTKTSGDLSFSDNVKAVFGAGSDLQIYHSGSNSFIDSDGVGVLFIRQNVNDQDIRIQSDDSAGGLATYIQCDGSTGVVTLNYYGSTKLSTKTDGVDITGELQSDSLDVDGAADISGQVNFHSNVVMDDNNKLIIGTGSDLQIYHDGTASRIDDVGTGSLILRGNGAISLQKYTGETMAQFTADAAVALYYNNGQKLATSGVGVTVTGSVTASDYFGLNAANYMQFSNNSYARFVLNSGERARVEADGDFHADGDVIAFSTTVSDERLKTDIEKIENATDKVSQLNGYTFTYKADGKKSAGVIAQEVEKVLPSAVSEKELPLKMDDGVAYKTVQYDQIIGLLIESIKELKQEINDLKGD